MRRPHPPTYEESAIKVELSTPGDADTRLREIEALNSLIRSCDDTRRGLKAAAALVDDTGLRTVLVANARELAAFVKQLQSLVLLRGGRPATRGSTSAMLDRGVMSLRAILPLSGDDRLASKCEKLGASVAEAYDRALEMSMPREYQLVLDHHRDEIRQMKIALESAVST